MKESLALGIDLGGSKIYAAVTDARNRVLASYKTPTVPHDTPENIISTMLDTGKCALASIGKKLEDAEYIGAAFPSPIDPETGDCTFATNLGGRNFSAKKIFRELAGREVYLGNDGDLGTLAEFRYQADPNEKSLIGFFIGTGLGGGIIVDGKLLRGNCGLAGELGHMIIRKGGRRCGCGHRGCIEAYCSKVAFVKAIQKAMVKRNAQTLLPPDKFNARSTNIKSKYLAKAYADGDPLVREAVDKGSLMLGIAAASACALVAPERIVLGGGVAASMGQYIMPVFRKSFEAHIFGLPMNRIQLTLSAYGDDAVAVGATILARKEAAR